MWSTSLTKVAFGVDSAAAPFTFDSLTEQMRVLSGQPYVAATAVLPDFAKNLDYDGYRLIKYRPDRAVHVDDFGGYQVQAFHLGWLYNEPVLLSQVTDGIAEPIQFSSDDFEYLNAEFDAAHQALPGVAGFRINYPLNRPENYDELISFLGASYFRALGRNNLYGASARGAVLNSWVDVPEEFPRFSAFYIERGTSGQPLAVNATLEGPSVTGAYRFEITPADDTHQDTRIDVTARLFARADIKELGIAPLTSMFLYAETNRSQFDDFRPQVHDSNGLFVLRDGGEAVWRALNNPPSLANSYFGETNPRAFGLMQRDRSFETYQDAGAHYERRPSILIEPAGDWGAGAIRLIEVPAKLEAEDNIVAFWVPQQPLKAGDSLEIKYRLRWGDLQPAAGDALAYVAETRAGKGGVSGVANADTLRKFVVDFAGGPLDALDPATKLDAVATVTGGTLFYSAVSRIEANGMWRLAIDAEISGTEPVELRAYLVGQGRQLSETWLYQWRAA